MFAVSYYAHKFLRRNPEVAALITQLEKKPSDSARLLAETLKHTLEMCAHRAGCLKEASPDAAKRQAQSLCKKFYPPQDGWEGHEVALIQMDVDFPT